MPCTTILVGKKASNDNSTMIARTDDGFFDIKKMITVTPEMQPKVYKSVLSHVVVPLPEDPMRYTACPNVDLSDGLWATTGINAANVGMTATETITSNPRVLAADPLVVYKKAKKSTPAFPVPSMVSFIYPATSLHKSFAAPPCAQSRKTHIFIYT